MRLNVKQTGRSASNLMLYSKGLRQDVGIFAMALYNFIKARGWETGWQDELHGVMYAPSLDEFVKRHLPDGMGSSVAWVYGQLIGPSKLDEASREALHLFCEQIKTETGINPADEYRREERGEAIKVELPEREIGIDGGKAGPGRGNKTPDNISRFNEQYGTSATHTLRRLKRDEPELAERVINGELSAHAAAIQAGFRKPSITLQSTNPQRAAERIHDVLGTEFATQLKEAL